MAREPQFCRFPQKPVRYFDKRSFRTIRTDGHRVVIGCKKGHWAVRKEECKIGTEAQTILYPIGTKRCPVWKPLAKGAKELGRITKKEFEGRFIYVTKEDLTPQEIKQAESMYARDTGDRPGMAFVMADWQKDMLTGKIIPSIGPYHPIGMKRLGQIFEVQSYPARMSMTSDVIWKEWQREMRLKSLLQAKKEGHKKAQIGTRTMSIDTAIKQVEKTMGVPSIWAARGIGGAKELGRITPINKSIVIIIGLIIVGYSLSLQTRMKEGFKV